MFNDLTGKREDDIHGAKGQNIREERLEEEEDHLDLQAFHAGQPSPRQVSSFPGLERRGEGRRLECPDLNPLVVGS